MVKFALLFDIACSQHGDFRPFNINNKPRQAGRDRKYEALNLPTDVMELEPAKKVVAHSKKDTPDTKTM